MTKFAEKVTFHRKWTDGPHVQNVGEVLIDGEPCPWYLAREPIRVEVDPYSGIATVYLPVLTESVGTQADTIPAEAGA